MSSVMKVSETRSTLTEAGVVQYLTTIVERHQWGNRPPCRVTVVFVGDTPGYRRRMIRSSTEPWT
jgi:hypothetical protein